MDFQLFVAKMQVLRQWSAQQAHDEWNRLKALPENIADYLGVAPHTLRLRIPVNLVGEDWSESSEEEFELKEFQSRNDYKNLTDEQKMKAKREMNIGFSSQLSTPAAASFSTSLATAAFTFQGELPVFSLCDMANDGGIGGSNSAESPAKNASGMDIKVVARFT